MSSSTSYLWKALLGEFIGTFILVFVGSSAVALTAQQGGSLIGSAFAYGLALMVMIYSIICTSTSLIHRIKRKSS